MTRGRTVDPSVPTASASPASSVIPAPGPGDPAARRSGPPPRWPGPPWLRRLRSRWDRASGPEFSAAVYVVTRVPALVALLVYRARHPRIGVGTLARTWDGYWYLQIAQHGYSRSLRLPVDRASDWHHSYSTWAFFPGYPLVVAAVHAVTRAPWVATAIAVSLVAGFLAVWATYALGTQVAGPAVGRGAALLLAAWPGSAVFGQPYSEGLYLAAAAAGLTLLLRERFVAAGLLGAVATATRPTGVAFVVAAAAVAVRHLQRDRRLRPLLAPALSLVGMGAFVAYGGARTGDLFVWRHAENLWTQHFDLSHKLFIVWYDMLRTLPSLVHTEGGRELIATNVLQIAGALALAVLAVTLLRRPHGLGMPLLWYTGVALVTVIAYSAVGPRPRTLMPLVPGFVWAAQRWPRWVTLVVAAVMIPLIGLVEYLWLWKVTP